MKNISLSILMSFLWLASIAQIPHPIITQALGEMNTDSIFKNLNEFSGEVPCYVYGVQKTIRNRVSNNGNELAGDYLKERLEKMGLTVTDQKYSAKGRNIIAEQKGLVYPDQKYILAGHYDSMADYCADDDASSVCGILETIRVLSKYKFKYTIVYVFWDEEELGLYGSAYYAKQAKAKSDKIKGVVNIDMIGYDGDNDNLFEVHTKSSSLALSDKALEVHKAYNIGLKPNVKNPGTNRSDHASFWNQGYNAIFFCQGYFSGDGNPAYHKSTDRIKLMNLPYYYKIVKLGMFTIATLAEPLGTVGVETVDNNRSIKLETYPNPTNGHISIDYDLPENCDIEITVLNILNQSTEKIHSGMESAGAHQLSFNTEQLAVGTYLITLTTKTNSISKKVVVQR